MTVQLDAGNERDAGVIEEICGYITASPSSSFFLFAGAGSGKTRTLVETLRRLTGVIPHDAGANFSNKLRVLGQQIRVITYTRNAVDVINGRLGENDLTRVTTIHAFCWDLISGFDSDIRDALININHEKLVKVNQKANSRRAGPTDADQVIIQELIEKRDALIATTRFVYSPDSNTYKEGALQHSQVLAVTERLLQSNDTLKKILYNLHPVILIDESQDTMKGILGVLMNLSHENSDKIMLGLIGDHRQRIYMDGHQDLPGIVPDGWHKPKLEMNHRSQQRIVDLINKIWSAEINGRTQPATGVTQHARSEKTGGTVKIFVGDTSLPVEEKIRYEHICASKMAEDSNCEGWNVTDSDYQILALEHRLAAKRGGFLDTFDSLSLIDRDSTRPQSSYSNPGPTAIHVLLREILELETCINTQGLINEFSAMEVLYKYDRLDDLSLSIPEQQSRLAILSQAVNEFAQMCLNPHATIRDVLTPIINYDLFSVSEKLIKEFTSLESPPPIPARPTAESSEDRIRRGWHLFFNTSWSEIKQYKKYLQGKSNLATHQVVKGSEFDNVMVVMDDSDAGGSQFSYDKIFGAKSLSQSDVNNIDNDKETSIDRTLRLLYVTCSRAKENLVLVLWSSNPDAAHRNIIAGDWFSSDEVFLIPKDVLE